MRNTTYLYYVLLKFLCIHCRRIGKTFFYFCEINMYICHHWGNILLELSPFSNIALTPAHQGSCTVEPFLYLDYIPRLYVTLQYCYWCCTCTHNAIVFLLFYWSICLCHWLSIHHRCLYVRICHTYFVQIYPSVVHQCFYFYMYKYL